MISNTQIINIARELGFDLVGFAKAEELRKESGNLERWLNRGYQAGMKYMERNTDKRKDVKEILPAAQSVISLGMNYYVNEKHQPEKGEVVGCEGAESGGETGISFKLGE